MGYPQLLREKIKYTSAFIIYRAISLKQGFKRDAKSVLGEREPCENELRERTKFHRGEEIEGHGTVSVPQKAESIHSQRFTPFDFVPII